MAAVNSKNWYIDAKRFIEEIFGNDADLFTALLVATSPQVTVQINWNLACKIYQQFKTGQEPDLISCMRNHKANVKRVLAGELLQGNKVKAFYANLRGDLSEVTIDGWMLKLFGWADRHTSVTPSNNQYRKLARAFRSVAKNNGYEPAEFQAILWVKFRTQNGYEPVSILSVGADKRQYTFEDLY